MKIRHGIDAYVHKRKGKMTVKDALHLSVLKGYDGEILLVGNGYDMSTNRECL